MAYQIIDPPPASLEVSLVIPVKDEAENVLLLADEIRAAMEPSPYAWECIWVDDGSSDGTGDLLRHAAAADPRQRVLTLERNFGQSAAMACGISAARGKLLVTLDGDGQSDPADIPGMLALLVAKDVDLVNGWRAKREDSGVRKVASRIANAFRNWVTEEEVRDVGCSLRVMRRDCVRHLFVFRGMHRFLPTLMRLNGLGRTLEVPVHHRPRLRGKTKYGINNRLWVGLADLFGVWWLLRRTVAPRVRADTALDAHREVGT
jgi:glycosyltransferase involved in cell wall biosynthesis